MQRGRTCQQILFTRILVEVNGEVNFYYAGELIRPQIVVNWLVNRSARGFQLLKAFEAAGYPVVNSADGWWSSGSDFLTSLCLHRNQVPHPCSWHAFSWAGANTNRQRLAYPLIHLPSGRFGNSTMIRLEDQTALEKRLQAFRGGQQSLDFQQARESQCLGLVQVFVLDGRALAAYSIAQNFWGQPQHSRRALLALEEGVTVLAEKAARGLGLDFCAVKLYQYAEEWEVSTVIASPDFSSFEESFGLNIAGSIADWLCKIK